jgi:hypothetical protein
LRLDWHLFCAFSLHLSNKSHSACRNRVKILSEGLLDVPPEWFCNSVFGVRIQSRWNEFWSQHHRWSSNEGRAMSLEFAAQPGI